MSISTGAKAVSDGDPGAPFSEAARKKLEATATFLVNASKKSEANAPKTKLLDASQLTEDDLRAVRKTEYFLPRGDTRFGRGPSGDVSNLWGFLLMHHIRKRFFKTGCRMLEWI